MNAHSPAYHGWITSRFDAETATQVLRSWGVTTSAPTNSTGTPGYFVSNWIASCAQPDTGGPFDAVSGR